MQIHESLLNISRTDAGNVSKCLLTTFAELVHAGASEARKANEYDHEREYVRVTTDTTHQIVPAFLTSAAGIVGRYQRNRNRWRARSLSRYTIYPSSVTTDMSEVYIVDLTTQQQELNRIHASRIVQQAQVLVIPRLASFEEKSDGTDDTVTI